MNKERILALANLIEKAPKGNVYMDENGFDMTDFTHHCGTPACIAGWSIWEYFGRTDENIDELMANDRRSYSSIACVYLGIDNETGEELFFPNCDRVWGSITPQEGAKVLRHFVETGKVDWTVIEEIDSDA